MCAYVCVCVCLSAFLVVSSQPMKMTYVKCQNLTQSLYHKRKKDGTWEYRRFFETNLYSLYEYQKENKYTMLPRTDGNVGWVSEIGKSVV